MRRHNGTPDRPGGPALDICPFDVRARTFVLGYLWLDIRALIFVFRYLCLDICGWIFVLGYLSLGCSCSEICGFDICAWIFVVG